MRHFPRSAADYKELANREGRVFSVDRVRSELLAGHKTEDLVRWVRDEVPEGFFVPVDTDVVVRAYTDVMMWVQRHSRYSDYAKAKFATGADGWLVAYAQVQGDSHGKVRYRTLPRSRINHRRRGGEGCSSERRERNEHSTWTLETK